MFISILCDYSTMTYFISFNIAVLLCT